MRANVTDYNPALVQYDVMSAHMATNADEVRVSGLLTDGWEPFAVAHNVLWLRRRAREES